MSPRELWARSYAQFVAEKPGDPAMLEAIRGVREQSLGSSRFSQWSEEDFAPISAAIEALFNKLGWMR